MNGQALAIHLAVAVGGFLFMVWFLSGLLRFLANLPY